MFKLYVVQLLSIMIFRSASQYGATVDCYSEFSIPFILFIFVQGIRSLWYGLL